MWVILSLLSAAISAIYHLTLQNIKLERHIFMIYRGIIPVFALLPIVLLNPILFQKNFYLLALIQGCASAYGDYLAFKINKKYGSEVICSITPFSIILTFILWCLIDFDTIQKYLNNTTDTMLIFLSFSGIIISLMNYMKNNFTYAALIAMFPLLLLSSCIAVLSKSVMSYSAGNLIVSASQNLLITSFIIALIHLIIYKKNNKSFKKIFLLKNIIRGSVLLLLVLFVIIKFIAMYYAFNPAYVSCLYYTMILWVIFFSKNFSVFRFAQSKNQGERKWKLLFISSVILLILVTN